MSKRSAEEKINYYNRKIRKLQKQKKRRRVIEYSTSDSDEHVDNGTNPSDQHNGTPTPSDLTAPTLISDSSAPMLPDPTGLELGEMPPEQNLTSEKQMQISDDVANDPAAEIDPELLLALGDPLNDIPVYGPDIHTTLAQRWLPILKKGILAEPKEKLLKSYMVPKNCKLLKAPTLNPEISAAVTDHTRLRDKRMQIKQDQLGIGITAISRAMTLLLTNEHKTQAVKYLSDGCRILADLHFMETQIRSKIITPGLEKSILTVLQEESRDETLFGNNLSEKIKASKAIEKQGLQIKKTQNLKAPSSTASSSNARSRYQGNWSGPPRYHSVSRGGRTTPYRTQYRRAPPQPPPPPAPRPSISATTTANKRAPARQ